MGSRKWMSLGQLHMLSCGTRRSFGSVAVGPCKWVSVGYNYVCVCSRGRTFGGTFNGPMQMGVIGMKLRARLQQLGDM